jgi:hypothetical protein
MKATANATGEIGRGIVIAGLAALLAACQLAGAGPSGVASPATIVVPAPGEGTLLPPAPEAAAPGETPGLECLSREELDQLSLAERGGLATLCYRSADGVETTIDQANQIAGIRAFLGDPDRVIGFREITFQPNSPDGRLRTALYEDERGLHYYYAVAADKVVEMSPAAYTPVVGPDALSEPELKAIAEALIERELPEFEMMQAGLTPSGGEKSGGLYFFRWEGSPIAGEGSMPPLAQVGVTASGEVFSYINTLYFLK